jgi:hypothetical protein
MNKVFLLKLPLVIVLTIAGILGLTVLLGVSLVARDARPAFAQSADTPTPTPNPTPTAAPMQGTGGHGDCLSCHSNPNLVGKFTNGETKSLYYDESQHTSSIHADRGMDCRACHIEQKDYPHPMSLQNTCSTCHWEIANGQKPSQDTPLVFDIPLESPRALSLQLNQACEGCHQTQAKEVVDSDHELIRKKGNTFAPVCVDCHGSHDVAAVGDSRSDIPQICSKCHLAVYTTYKSSVHGAALDANSNPDVPTCANCHGTHVVKGPNEANFRADSIAICGKCHADKSMMSKYGISTDVFNTYLDDFHGRTVNYSRLSSKLNVDKATCYDCHGVHNILSPQDKASTVYPSNLQHTCQQCHPDADITFPEAWLSHKVPDWNNAPVVFTVNILYKYFMIPVIIGGMVIYILLDARRRIANRWKQNAGQKPSGQDPKV